MVQNSLRSERTRAAAIQAALRVIARDGAAHLTLDAIAKESGVSKGGLMHQFPNKRAVLQSLLEYQAEFFEKFTQDFYERRGKDFAHPVLAAQIATFREILCEPNSRAFAVLAAVAQDPEFLSAMKQGDADLIERIKSESDDPNQAILYLFAARGLAFSTLMGLSPLSDQERDALFQRFLEDGGGLKR